MSCDDYFSRPWYFFFLIPFLLFHGHCILIASVDLRAFKTMD